MLLLEVSFAEENNIEHLISDNIRTKLSLKTMVPNGFSYVRYFKQCMWYLCRPLQVSVSICGKTAQLPYM